MLSYTRLVGQKEATPPPAQFPYDHRIPPFLFSSTTLVTSACILTTT